MTSTQSIVVNGVYVQPCVNTCGALAVTPPPAQPVPCLKMGTC